MEAIQSSLDGMDNNLERIQYTDSEDSEGEDALEIGSLEASNPYLNFSFMNLPNLHAISQESYVKNSPRLFEEDDIPVPGRRSRNNSLKRSSNLRVTTQHFVASSEEEEEEEDSEEESEDSEDLSTESASSTDSHPMPFVPESLSP